MDPILKIGYIIYSLYVSFRKIIIYNVVGMENKEWKSFYKKNNKIKISGIYNFRKKILDYGKSRANFWHKFPQFWKFRDDPKRGSFQIMDKEKEHVRLVNLLDLSIDGKNSVNFIYLKQLRCKLILKYFQKCDFQCDRKNYGFGRLFTRADVFSWDKCCWGYAQNIRCFVITCES